MAEYRKKVLIVDDAHAVRTFLGKMLDKMGFSYVTANNGKNALSKLNDQGPFELAFVDLDMPVMGGLAFIQAIREQPLHAQLKVILLVANVAEIGDIDTTKHCIVDVLTKPFDTDLIRRAIEMHLGD